MTEFIRNNKWAIIRVIVLLFVFLLVVGYINGRSVYNQRMLRLEETKNAFQQG